MSNTWTTTGVKILAMLLAASSVIGDQPAVPPRSDRLGDPLPYGAILRLGSERLSHQGTVFCTAFSPDGKILASGGGYYDSTVRLWEPATGKEILRLTHPGPVRDLTWSKDGKLLVTASDGGGIRFWDVATGKQVRHLPQDGAVVRVALSDDGKTLALREADFGGSGKKDLLRLRDAATGKELHCFAVGRAYNVAFSPDGQIVALGGEDQKIRLWEVRTGKELPSLREHKAGTYAVAFSANGKFLASGGSSPDSATYLWEWPSRRLVHRLDTPRYTVGAIRFSPDGNTVATGSGHPNGIIQLWDVATGKQTRQLQGHRSPIDSFTFSADGKRIASAGSWERAIRLWDVADGKECSPFARHHGEVAAVAFAPDGSTLATASHDQTIALWKTTTGAKVGELLGHRGGVNAVAYSPDGQLLASGSDDKTARIWQAATGKELHQFQGHKLGVTTVAFTPDSKTLAAGAGGTPDLIMSGMRMPDGAIWLWDIAAAKPVHVLEAKAGRVNSVAFSPDGRILASAGPDEAMIHLWDPKTGKAIGKLESDPEPATPPTMAEGITRIVFSPDGKTLVSVSRYRYPGNIRAIDDKKTREVRVVRLWEVATLKERLQIRVPFHASESSRDERRNEITCAAFSADGQVLILGKKDGDIALWHIPAGKEIRLMRAHHDLVTAVVLAPDGRTFATASEDTTALLWNATALHEPWQTRITAKQRDSLWVDLASADAPRAYQAIWALAGAPVETLALLKERLRPVPKMEPEKIARLIKALEVGSFVEREKATSELEKLADVVADDLRQALTNAGSLESRRRIEELLAKHGGSTPSLETLRSLRAVEVLEHSANPAARQILQALTEGASEARLTRDARAALTRLTRGRP
jgi:WD40 repeat protein